MIDFKCSSCGEREERNVLPGKHAVLGSIAQIERNADCCEDPQYFDSRGFKENSVHRDLRDMLPRVQA